MANTVDLKSAAFIGLWVRVTFTITWEISLRNCNASSETTTEGTSFKEPRPSTGRLSMDSGVTTPAPNSILGRSAKRVGIGSRVVGPCLGQDVDGYGTRRI